MALKARSVLTGGLDRMHRTPGPDRGQVSTFWPLTWAAWAHWAWLVDDGVDPASEGASRCGREGWDDAYVI